MAPMTGQPIMPSSLQQQSGSRMHGSHPVRCVSMAHICMQVYIGSCCMITIQSLREVMHEHESAAAELSYCHRCRSHGPCSQR